MKLSLWLAAAFALPAAAHGSTRRIHLSAEHTSLTVLAQAEPSPPPPPPRWEDGAQPSPPPPSMREELQPSSSAAAQGSRPPAVSRQLGDMPTGLPKIITGAVLAGFGANVLAAGGMFLLTAALSGATSGSALYFNDSIPVGAVFAVVGAGLIGSGGYLFFLDRSERKAYNEALEGLTLGYDPVRGSGALAFRLRF